MDNRNARIENAFPMAAVRLEGFEPPTPGSEVLIEPSILSITSKLLDDNGHYSQVNGI